MPSRTIRPPLTIVSDSDPPLQLRYPLSLQSMDALSKPSRTVLPPLSIAFPVINSVSPSPESSRSAKSLYWCEYCGKGFIRPSSLKVRLLAHVSGRRNFNSIGRSRSTYIATQANVVSFNTFTKIALSADTGHATAFRCTFEGCHRTFAVQSNMRRHARAHLRSRIDTRESEGEDSEEGSPQPQRVQQAQRSQHAQSTNVTRYELNPASWDGADHYAQGVGHLSPPRDGVPWEGPFVAVSEKDHSVRPLVETITFGLSAGSNPGSECCCCQVVPLSTDLSTSDPIRSFDNNWLSFIVSSESLFLRARISHLYPS